MNVPDGIDIHPEPVTSKRFANRLVYIVLTAIAIVACLVLYGIQSRRTDSIHAAADSEKNKPIEPASPKDAKEKIPNAVIQPPEQPIQAQQPGPLVPPPQQYQPYVPPPLPPYPEERRPVEKTPQQIAAERELEAMRAPMVAVRQESSAPLQRAQVPQEPPLASSSSTVASRRDAPPTDEYTLTNLQAQKTAFLDSARARSSSNYLPHTRAPQIGPYEIKAGWEIPAVLEQEINSDLPGELKGLVTQNVYDTATGQYLLIPQGSRVLGRYSADVAYGQDGAQVVWNRIIFPDGSSVNLDGMIGMDSRGNAGLRHKVDRHYKRTFGMAFLTSAFVAMYELTNRRSYPNGGFQVPTAGDRVAGAMGGEMSQTAAQVTRKNMNTQPTIKIPIGYKFIVRVNKDMLFESPYRDETVRPDEPQHKGIAKR